MANGDDDFEELTTNPQNFTTSAGSDAPPQTQSDKTKTPGAAKSSTGKGGKTKKKGKKKTLFRGKLTPKQYHKKEIEIRTKQHNECLDMVYNQSWETEELRDDEVFLCDELFKQQVAGANARLGMKSTDDAGSEKDAYVGDDAWKERYKKQTDQNFLMMNLQTLTQNEDAPTPYALENLSLISKYKGNLINKMTVSSKLGPLMEATPLQLSMLVPYFRLFRKSKKTKKIEEFQFTDRLQWDYNISPSGNRADIENRILNSSLGQGVGFKSFNWETTGTNLFSAPRTLMATLKLHFQSISELVRTARNSGAGGPLWLDLIIPQPGRTSIPRECPEGAEYGVLKDHIENQTPPSAWIKGSQDPKYVQSALEGFDILAEIGWNYSPMVDEKIISKEFKAAVDASRLVLDLSLISHKFNFREEGTIDLQINYVARMEGLMDTYDANLFNLDDSAQDNEVFKQLEALKEEVKTLKFNMSSPYGVMSCAEKELGGTENILEKDQKNLDANRKEIESEIIKLEKAQEAFLKELKWSLYQKFSTFLLQNRILFSVDVTKQQYAMGDLENYALNEVGNAQDIEIGTKQVTHTKKAEKADKSGKIQEGKFDADQIKNSFHKIVGTNLGLNRKHMRRVPFFYLGDLINFYANALPGNKATMQRNRKKGVKKEITSEEFDKMLEGEKLNIVLGDMTFLNYKEVGRQFDQSSDYEGLDDAAKKNKIEKTVSTILDNLAKPGGGPAYALNYNMAYIPISFDAYTSWFASEILNGSSVFTFKTFLQSLTTKLLVASMQSIEVSSVNGDLRRSLKERTVARASLLCGSNKYIGSGHMHYEKRDPATGESTLLIRSAPVRDSGLPDYSKMETSANMGNRQFLVLSVSRLPHSSQIVDEAKNASEGVYHLKLGASKGLVKTIALNRESNSRIRDANIMRAYNQGGAGLGVIQEPYQAEVKLFGSGFFQPGTYVYINPTNIGLGTSAERYSIARRLGIGGFYFVTKVSNTLTEQGLSTSLKCYFQNYGYLPSVDNLSKGSDPIDETSEGQTPAGDAPKLDS